MSKHPLQFLEVPRRDPEKESADGRVQHFGEIYGQYDGASAAAQAAMPRWTSCMEEGCRRRVDGGVVEDDPYRGNGEADTA